MSKAHTNYLTHRAQSVIHLLGHVITYTIENLMVCYSCNRSFITRPKPEVVKSISRLHNILICIILISHYLLILS
jgi:hypothetical protein